MNRLTRTTVPVFMVAASAALSVTAHEGKLSFAPVLEEVTPAVVNIQVAGERAQNPFHNDPFFRRFFPNQRPPERGYSAGSGVIIDAKRGHVVTNHHLIEDADEITVKLKDRREFAAELIGSDPATDIALLKIDAKDLHSLPFGDSEELSVGDFVIAIGNPFNLGQTVTSGIVSALGRGGFSRDGYEDFIQTDASINRGNSGGALVDIDGQLVGINTVIVSPSGVSAGLGFAVPTSIVKVIADQLLEFGEVRRGHLGIMILDLQPEDIDALDLKTTGGVIVREVLPDGGAEAAGVEPGDVIVSLDGEEVIGSRDLRARVGLAQIGEKVELGIIRDGKRRRLKATIEMASPATVAGADTTPKLAGARLGDLAPDHQLFDRVRGVAVLEVTPGSPAWLAGLRASDVILRANYQRVTNVGELDQLVADANGLLLHIRRGERRLFIIVR